MCGSGSNTDTGTGWLAGLLELIWRGNYAMLKCILTGQAEREREGRGKGKRGKRKERAEGRETERDWSRAAKGRGSLRQREGREAVKGHTHTCLPLFSFHFPLLPLYYIYLTPPPVIFPPP